MPAKVSFTFSAIAILVISHAMAHANDTYPLDWVNKATGCYSLLTEDECIRFKPMLDSLPEKIQRMAYLESQGVFMLEREAMCTCRRNAPKAHYYPHHKQKVAQY